MRLVSFVALVLMGFSASAQYDSNYSGPGTPIDPSYGAGIGPDSGAGGIAPNYENEAYQVVENYVDQEAPLYQEQYVPPQQSTDDEIYQRAYAETGGACDIRQNPHSYACTTWTFEGNGVFPLFQMDWWGGEIQGNWFSVTYVRPSGEEINCGKGLVVRGENEDCEFSMVVNSQRPTIPMGIKNTRSGKLMERMFIQDNVVGWENWLGRTVWSAPETFVMVGDYAVKFQMFTEGGHVHEFKCKDFNRNSNHHLLCRWDMYFPETGTWSHKGYMGFLTMSVWDSFMSRLR